MKPALLASLAVATLAYAPAGTASAAASSVNCNDMLAKQQVERLVGVLLNNSLDPYPVNRTSSWSSWPKLAQPVLDVLRNVSLAGHAYEITRDNTVHLVVQGKKGFEMSASKWNRSGVTLYTCSYTFPGELRELSASSLSLYKADKMVLTENHKSKSLTVSSGGKKRLVTLIFASPHSWVSAVNYLMKFTQVR